MTTQTMTTAEPTQIVRYNVREARRRFGGTQAAFAQSLGITVPYLSDLERGLYNPSAVLFAKICNEAKCTPSDLVYLDIDRRKVTA